MILFLDFDGTLVPIVQRPELAILDENGRRLIESLSKRIPVVIISGRGLDDVRGRVGVNGVNYVGNHGLEIEGNNLKYRMNDSPQWTKFINELSLIIEQSLGGIHGVIVENKGVTLSVHYRLVSGATRKRALQLFSKCIEGYKAKRQVRVTHGKMVWEVRPPFEWHKGKAVMWIMKQPQFMGRWPLYIGDDRTDQDALKLVRENGVGIWIGAPKEKGAALHAIEDPRSVRQLLKWLLVQVSEKSGSMKKI